MKKDVKQFIYQGNGDQNYYFAPEQNNQEVLVLNSVFRKTSEINISKAFIELKGAGSATNLTLYWDKTGVLTDFSNIEDNVNVEKLDFTTNIRDIARFDVTKVVATLLKEGALQRNQRYILIANEIPTIGLDVSSSIYYDYKNGYKESKATLPFELENADVSVDMSDGNIRAQFVVNKGYGRIPAIVQCNYNSRRESDSEKVYLDDGTFEEINYYFAKGWKLNYQQFLVKESSNLLLSDGESVAFYTWVNSQGLYITFAEKYYAVINGENKYLTKSQVVFSEDGSLTAIINGVSYEVIHKIDCREQFTLEEIAVSETEKKCVITDLVGNKITFDETTLATKENSTIFRLAKMEDNYSNVVNVLYDENGKLDSVQSVGGNTARIGYDSIGRIESIYEIYNGLNITTTFEFDAQGNLYKITTPENHRNLEMTYYSDTNFIKTLLGASGKGHYFELLSNKVSQIRCIAKNGGIENKDEIPYKDTNKLVAIDGVNYKYQTLYSISYEDRKTVLTESRNSEKNVYLFDYFGRLINVCDNNYDGEGNGTPQVKTLSLTYENINCVTENVFGSNDLCVNFVTQANSLNDISEITSEEVKQNMQDFISKNNPKSGSNKKVYFADSSTDTKTLEFTLNDTNINTIRNSDSNNFVISCWAQANSFPFNGSMVGLRPNYNNFERLYFDTSEENLVCFDENEIEPYHRHRRFDLCAEVYYTSEESDNEYDLFSVSFDPTNDKFQQVTLPIRLRLNEKPNLEKIIIYVNYKNNNGKVFAYGLSMKSGHFDFVQLNNSKQKIAYRSREEENYFVYNSYNQLTKLLEKTEKHGDVGVNLTYSVEYEYNDKKMLVKNSDSKGFVNEYVYNDKGDLTKTINYRVEDETSSLRFVNESEYDIVSGEEIKTKNPFGVYDKQVSYVNGAISSVSQPESSTITYQYDSAFNLVKSMSATVDGIENKNETDYYLGLSMSQTHSGARFDYDYDGFGRITAIRIDNEPYCEISYDSENEKTVNYANGERERIATSDNDKKAEVYFADTSGKFKNTAMEMKLSSYGTFKQIEDEIAGGKIKVQYDDCGRISKSVVENDDEFYDVIIKNNYDNKGVLTERVYEHESEDIDVVSYTYEDEYEGKVIQAYHSSIDSEYQSYDSLGRVARSSKLGDDLVKEYSYKNGSENLTSNLIANESYIVVNDVEESFDYEYDTLQRLTTVSKNGIIIKKYTYDGLGRLAREDNRDLNKTFAFTYDNAGNITNRFEYAFTLGVLPVNAVATFGYTYDATHKDRLLSYNGESCSNYVLGNPNTYRGKTATWTNVHRLASFDNVQFSYNCSGTRMAKVCGNVLTKFAINGSDIIAQDVITYNGNAVASSDRILFYYGLDGVTGFKYGNAYYYYKKNFLGDIIGIYDENDDLVAKYVYDAWGNHKVLTPDGTENTSPDFIGNINPFRYRSYYFDVETGFYYLQSRYYDPQVGRFISMDAVEYLAPQTINGLNLYAYCCSDPVNKVDPTGTFLVPAIALIGSFIRAAVATAIIVTAVVATVSDIVALATGEVSAESSEKGDSVQIKNSYKIKTPWVQSGYSFYVNHIKSDTKDIIKGSSSGMQYEWFLHNVAHDFGIGDKESSAHVDFGKSIFSDDSEKHGIKSHLMKITYILGGNPISVIWDLIANGGY